MPLSGKTPRRQTLPPANGTDSTPRLTSTKDNNQDLLFNSEPNLRDYESEHSTSRNVRTDLECAHLNINIPLNNTPVHGILGMGESMYRTGVSPPRHVGDEPPPQLGMIPRGRPHGAPWYAPPAGSPTHIPGRPSPLKTHPHCRQCAVKQFPPEKGLELPTGQKSSGSCWSRPRA